MFLLLVCLAFTSLVIATPTPCEVFDFAAEGAYLSSSTCVRNRHLTVPVIGTASGALSTTILDPVSSRPITSISCGGRASGPCSSSLSAIRFEPRPSITRRGSIEVPNSRIVFPSVPGNQRLASHVLTGCFRDPSTISAVGATVSLSPTHVTLIPSNSSLPAISLSIVGGSDCDGEGFTAIISVTNSIAVSFRQVSSVLPTSRGLGFVDAIITAVPHSYGYAESGLARTAYPFAHGLTNRGPRPIRARYRPVTHTMAEIVFVDGGLTHLRTTRTLSHGTGRSLLSLDGSLNASVMVTMGPPVDTTIHPGKTVHGTGFSLSQLWHPDSAELLMGSLRVAVPGALEARPDSDRPLRISLATAAALGALGVWLSAWFFARLRNGDFVLLALHSIGWFAVWLHFVILFHVIRFVVLLLWATLWLPLVYGLRLHVSSKHAGFDLVNYRRSAFFVPQVALLRIVASQEVQYFAPSRPWPVRSSLGVFQAFWHTLLATSILRPWAPWNTLSPTLSASKEVTLMCSATDKDGVPSMVPTRVILHAIFPNGGVSAAWVATPKINSPESFSGVLTGLTVVGGGEGTDTSVYTSPRWIPLRLPSCGWVKWYLRWLLICSLIFVVMNAWQIVYAVAEPISVDDVRAWRGPSDSPCKPLPSSAISLASAGGNWSLRGIPLSTNAPCFFAYGATHSEILYFVNNGAATRFRVTNLRYGLTANASATLRTAVGCQSLGMSGPPFRVLPPEVASLPGLASTCSGPVSSTYAVLAQAECDFYTDGPGRWNLLTLYRGAIGAEQGGASACLIGDPTLHYAAFADVTIEASDEAHLNAFAVYVSPYEFSLLPVTAPITPQVSSLVAATVMIRCAARSSPGECVRPEMMLLRAGAPVLQAGASLSDIRFDLIGGIPLPQTAAPAVLSAIGLLGGLSAAKKSAEFWEGVPPYSTLPLALSWLSSCETITGMPVATTNVTVTVETTVALHSSCPVGSALVAGALGSVGVTCFLAGLRADATSTANASAMTTVTEVSYGVPGVQRPGLPSAPDPRLFLVPPSAWEGTASADASACSFAGSVAEPQSCVNRTGALCGDGLYHHPVLDNVECSSSAAPSPFVITGDPDLLPFELDGTWRGCNTAHPEYYAYFCGTQAGKRYGCYARVFGAVSALEHVVADYGEDCSSNPGQPIVFSPLGFIQMSGPLASPTDINHTSTCGPSIGVWSISPILEASAAVAVPSQIRAPLVPCHATSANVTRLPSGQVMLAWDGAGEGMLALHSGHSHVQDIPCPIGSFVAFVPAGDEPHLSLDGSDLSMNGVPASAVVTYAPPAGRIHDQVDAESQRTRMTESRSVTTSVTTVTKGHYSSSTSGWGLVARIVHWPLHLMGASFAGWEGYLEDLLAAAIWVALLAGLAYLAFIVAQRWMARRQFRKRD